MCKGEAQAQDNAIEARCLPLSANSLKRARREVLDRLLALNHKRYAEEVKTGLHEKKRKAKKVRKADKAQTGQEQLSLL